jgi:hypothetical protein
LGGIQSNFFIHYFLALEGKIEQSAKPPASIRRTGKVSPYPAEKKNERNAQSTSLPFKSSLPVLCLSEYPPVGEFYFPLRSPPFFEWGEK